MDGTQHLRIPRADEPKGLLVGSPGSQLSFLRTPPNASGVVGTDLRHVCLHKALVFFQEHPALHKSNRERNLGWSRGIQIWCKTTNCLERDWSVASGGLLRKGRQVQGRREELPFVFAEGQVHDGWTKSTSHHLETMVETFLGCFTGESSFQGFLGGAKRISSIHNMLCTSHWVSLVEKPRNSVPGMARCDLC